MNTPYRTACATCLHPRCRAILRGTNVTQTDGPSQADKHAVGRICNVPNVSQRICSRVATDGGLRRQAAKHMILLRSQRWRLVEREVHRQRVERYSGVPTATFVASTRWNERAGAAQAVGDENSCSQRRTPSLSTGKLVKSPKCAVRTGNAGMWEAQTNEISMASNEISKGRHINQKVWNPASR